MRKTAMTILVSGGVGYIGSHMVYALVDAGEDVLVVDDLSNGFDWAVPKGVPLVVGNIGDQSFVTVNPLSTSRGKHYPLRSVNGCI
jgi:UDP-glucose 4-epimerase